MGDPLVIPAHLQAAWAEENREKLTHATLVVSLMGLCLHLAVPLYDYLAWPDHFSAFIWVRGATVVALGLLALIIYLVRSRDPAPRQAGLFTWALMAVVCASLDTLCVLGGGGDTPLYAANMMFLMALAVALPATLVQMAGQMLLICTQFLAVTLALDDTRDLQGYLTTAVGLCMTVFIALFWCVIRHRLQVTEFLARKHLEQEQRRSERLLLNILPEEVAEELKEHGRVKARNITSCSILFTDFVGFTKISGRVPPDRLVASLDAAFSRFDEIITRQELEKLKTIGDAYMCAGGVLGQQPDHLVRCVLAGLEMLRVLREEDLRCADGAPWRMRVGVHPGPVVAGVIGQKKFAYDLWGDTVNTASRLESAGQPDSINMTTAVYKQVEAFFVGVDRGFVPVRGKGPLAMTRVTRLRPELSDDEEGRVPNVAFGELLARWIRERPRPLP